ncbi:MAG: hypothetical protein GX601_06870, partial [Anaerolineales bacterium]|nr:hypothetical protein [Anaerolineales bacterium]
VGPYEAYDTSDPHRPVRLTGVRVEGQTVTVADPPAGGPRRYFVSAASAIQTADLRSAVTWTEPTGSDVLIIAPGNLVSSLAPLVALRKSQGLHTTVANLQAIYDLWSDGRPTPQAIRAFIAHAYATWSPRPSYVLLVGDGSYDPRRYLPSSPPTLIPPYLMKVDAWTSEGAADNRYVCMDGEHDMLADMHLGRLPVQSVAQAEALVQKIVAYESDPLPGNWNRWVRLVADDQEGQEGTALDFPAVSDAYSASYVSAPYWVGRTYCLGGDPARNDCPAAETETIRTSLVRALNEGGLFVQYTGHSSWQQWAHERFFHLDDLPALNNAGRLPVFVEMTCYTAAFHRPEPTLDESLVTLPQTGAAAAWGPTGLGVGSGHQRLASGFFEAVFVDEVETLGEATWAGRLELHSTYPSHYMLDAYVLLGDPAMQVHTDLLPWSQSVYLPLTFSGLH